MGLLIKRAQPFADEQLAAVGNFTWMGGREDLAGGLPDWTLIGAGATKLYVVTASQLNPDRGTALFGSWPLNGVRVSEETYERKIGQTAAGVYRAVRFAFPDRPPAVLQPFGWAAAELLEAQHAVRPDAPPRSDGLTRVALMTTADGPASDEMFLLLSYADGRTDTVPLEDDALLLTELQALPGFDNETFIQAMSVGGGGMWVLWQRSPLD